MDPGKVMTESRLTKSQTMFKAILEDNPVVAMKILALRWMIEQRNLSIRHDIIVEMGCSYEKVNSALRGSLYRFSYEDPSKPRRNTIATESLIRNLDEIEDAITAITAREGGVYAITGTTPEAAAVLREHLDRAVGSVGTFNEELDYEH